MSLVINHNLIAMAAARNLGKSYGMLATSTQSLSSGLRNASDAISMIQTADGAMSVIDEKLLRMKELAEQAATGTYTTAQRTIMDSEYQAVAAEVDRIATATDFNGVQLLDGSMTGLHGGSGMKIHFGTGNSVDSDYYSTSTSAICAPTRPPACAWAPAT